MIIIFLSRIVVRAKISSLKPKRSFGVTRFDSYIFLSDHSIIS